MLFSLNPVGQEKYFTLSQYNTVPFLQEIHRKILTPKERITMPYHYRVIRDEKGPIGPQRGNISTNLEGG
jgi:hypothetical protein